MTCPFVSVIMNEIKDLRKNLTPENSFAIPNDLVDKYMRILDKEQLLAVMDLVQQTYKAGVNDGRNESPLFAVIPVSILENDKLSANAKLLYGEIMALSKRNGKCYATNAHLGRMLSLSERSIPQLLKELSGIGLIMVDIKRNHRGTYRDIVVSFFNEGGHRSITRGVSQNNEGGIVKQRGLTRNRHKEIDIRKDTPAKAENWVKEILNWWESRKKTKFVDYGKQIGALGRLKKAGYEPEKIKRYLLTMEKDDFWHDKSPDFVNLAANIHKIR